MAGRRGLLLRGPGRGRVGLATVTEIINTADLVRTRVKRYGLHEFTLQFWKIADPAKDFIDGWHMGAVCEHLQAVTNRQISKLVINMPPGHTKSISASVMWPSWEWTIKPERAFMRISYDDKLVIRDAQKSIDICTSPLFCAAWPDLKLDPNQPVKNFTTIHGGRQFSTSIKSSGVGWHVDTRLGDDLLKPKDAASKTKTALDGAWELWTQTYATRQRDARTFASVLMMQRLHELDPAGRALKELGYEHLCLPLEYVPSCQWDMGSSLKFKDPRTEPGELLCPGRHTPETLADLKKELASPSAVAAQLQQNPQPDKGGYVEREWFAQRYQVFPVPLTRIRFRQYWDMGTKGRKEDSHSKVHGLLVGQYSGQIFLVDERSGHWNYPQTKKQFKSAQLNEMWRRAQVIHVEDKANGTPLLDDLKDDPSMDPDTVRKCKPWEPGSLSKEERFAIQSGKIEGGGVVLPCVMVGGQVSDPPWIVEWIDEIVGFPNAANNDRVDTLTMALEDLGDATARYRDAVARAAAD